jgi:single-strand DNA-binding protein
MAAFITVTGNMGKDPETRYTQAGTMMLKFSIGNSVSKQDGAPVTNWYNVTVWGKDAEFWADKLGKGDRVLVIGDFEIRSYVANDNTTKTSNDINAKKIERLTQTPVQSSAPANSNADYDDIPF